MPDYNFKNNLKSTLQSKLWSDATTISCNHVVESEDADTRRNAWPAFPFTLTVVDTANDNVEVIKCTSLASNVNNVIVFTCERAQETTTARTFEIATTSVEHRLTAGALNAITGSLDEITSNVSDYMAGLAGKANLDMDNLTQAGTTAIAHCAMPSSTRYIDVSVPPNSGTIIAPSDGYYQFKATATAVNANIVLTGSVVFSMWAPLTGVTLATFVPVGKDARVTVQLSNVTNMAIKFFYAKGAY